MASNLACVGLAASGSDDFEALVAAARPNAVRFGRVADVELLRWEDPSGARMVFRISDGQVVDFLPSFAADPTTRLGQVRRANKTVATAAVVDSAGDQLTSLAFECEQFRLLPDRPVDSALASVVFLGRKVSVHADDEAFGNSQDSLLDPNADLNAPAPPHYMERGLKWPPRVGSESFFSYGVFGEASQAGAGARFAGVVTGAERRTVHQTNQTFIVARVRTVGIDVSVCMSSNEVDAVPHPGQIIAGDVFIVGSIPALEAPQETRRWWQRARP
jgi:hypothetical protein